MRLAKYLIFIFPAILLLLWSGCGKKITNANLQTGDLADPAFLEVNEVMQEGSENSQDAIFEGFDAAFNYLFGGSPLSTSTADTIIYAYENGWHHLIVDYLDDTTGNTYYLDDSVQIKDTLGIAQQFPDTNNIGSVEVRVKRYVHIAAYDPFEDFQFKGDDTVLASASFVVNSGDSTATFNGLANEWAKGTFMHPDSAVECSLDLALLHVVDDVIIPIDTGDCPISGTISASGDVNIVCPFSTDTIRVSGSWTRIINIGQNSVTIICRNNTTQWILIIPKSQFCDNSPPVALDLIPGRFQN